MKKTILTLLSLAFVLTSIDAQRSAENIFRKYKNDSGVMYIDMGGDFAKFMDDGTGIQSKVESVQVMLFKKGENMSESDLSDLQSTLKSSPYELLIQAKMDKGKAKLYVIDSGDFFTEIFGSVESDEFNIYARVFGEVFYEDLAKLQMNLGNNMNFGELFGN